MTLEKLNASGLFKGQDVVDLGLNQMQLKFGNWGAGLFKKCNGEIVGAINPTRVRKSLSVERTFEYDKSSLEQCLNELPRLRQELEVRLANKRFDQANQQIVG